MTVAIIGAGLAGLACANELHAAGVDVTVYEASDGAGGAEFAVTSWMASLWIADSRWR